MVFAIVGCLHAQTSGTSLPPSCPTPGAVFFLKDATTGAPRDVFACSRQYGAYAKVTATMSPIALTPLVSVGNLMDYAPIQPIFPQTAVAFAAGAPVNGFTFPGPASVTISGTTDDHTYFYVDSAGRRTWGYASTNSYVLAGFEAAAVSGLTAVPDGSTPLYDCIVKAGSFTSCTSDLGLLSHTTLSAGAGISRLVTGNGIVLAAGMSPKQVTVANYAISSVDCGCDLEFTGTGSVSAILPQAGLAGNFGARCNINLWSGPSGPTVTVTVQGSSVGGPAIPAGATTFQVPPGTSRQVHADPTTLPAGRYVVMP